MKSASLALAVLTFAAIGAVPAVAQSPAPAASEWRTPDPENVLVVDTNKGRIIVEMSPATAPMHVERYRTLTRQKFFDGLKFFRVVDSFMDQTGDPLNKGTGSSELPDLKAEFPFRRGASPVFTVIDRLPPEPDIPSMTEVGFIGGQPVRSAPSMQMMIAVDGKVPSWGLFCAGVMGAARGGDPDSANSQFFFMRGTYPSLDANYTAWGRVLTGMEAVRAIKVGEPVPEPQDVMTRVRVLADIPAAERPKVQVLDTTGPAFKALVEQARANAGGRRLNPCDIDIPVKVG